MWTFSVLFALFFSPSEFNKNKSTQACVCLECHITVFLSANHYL